MIGFCEFEVKRNLEIESLSDERLVMVDPTKAGFYDNVLNYISENDDIQAFVEAVREVQKAGVEAFYRPVMDPSLEDDKVMYEKGKKPAVGHSYNWWVKATKVMPAIEGRNWTMGTEYQYYAFLVQLINSLVEDGWSMDKAVNSVVLDSKELGHYRNSLNALNDFETTGSREVCGFFDLANTCKLLSCTNEEVGGFWVAGGGYHGGSDFCPLADLFHDFNVAIDYFDSVAWLVLK